MPLAFVLCAGTRFDDDEVDFSVRAEDVCTMVAMMLGGGHPSSAPLMYTLGSSALFRRHPCDNTAISSSQRRRPSSQFQCSLRSFPDAQWCGASG